MSLPEIHLKDRHLILIFLLLAAACYGKVLNNYLFLDDTTTLYAGYLLSQDITKIATHNFDVIYMTPLWRVLVALSYVPNYLLSGIEPWSYYLTNILLHFGCTILAYRITNTLSRNRPLAFFTALCFSVSLNKADAVIMLAHRTTLLGAFFALLSLHFYAILLLDGYRNRLALYSFLAFLAALGSYETALVLPGTFLAAGVIYRGRKFFRGKLFFQSSFALAISLFLIFALNLKIGATGLDSGLFAKAQFICRNVLSVFPSFIIPPFLLQDNTSDIYSASAQFGIIEYLSLFLIMLVLAINLNVKNRQVSFGIVFFLIMAIPTSVTPWLYYPNLSMNAYQLFRWSVGKYSYLSSFGFFLLAGALLWHLYIYLADSRFRKYLQPTSVLILGLYICFNIYWIYEREDTWADLTSANKKQISALRKLGLKISPDTKIYFYGFNFNNKHMTALLRVIFKNPELEAMDARNYLSRLDQGSVMFLIAEGDDVSAYRDMLGKERW